METSVNNKFKAFTSLEQSKKLAEILPLESADMEYLAIKEIGKLVGDVPFVKDDSEVEDSAYSHIYDRIACWSLAALLGVLPEKYTKLLIKEEGMYRILIKDLCMTSLFNNPIDACVAMIEKLHKLKML